MGIGYYGSKGEPLPWKRHTGSLQLALQAKAKCPQLQIKMQENQAAKKNVRDITLNLGVCEKQLESGIRNLRYRILLCL